MYRTPSWLAHSAKRRGASWLHATAALFSICWITACATTNPYAIKTSAEMEQKPASPGQMKYNLLYGNPQSETIIDPHKDAIEAVLEKLGYERANAEEADVAIYVLVALGELVAKTREMNSRDTGVPLNPDSIRYKNLAAMVGGGRYTELLNDNPNGPGNVIMGPDGEMIETGSLRRQSPLETGETTELRRINRLIIAAMELPFPNNPSDVKLRWRIESISDLPINGKPPTAKDLVEEATKQLNKKHL